MGRTLQRGGVCRFVERGVSLERAIELACEVPMIRRTEIVSLDEARGRVLAAGLASKVDDPRFDNSAMDGFAVRAEDCTSSGTKLEIVGTSQAGSMDLPVVRKGQGCRIMTGAPIPEGADAIVMVEDTEIEGEHVIINGPVRPGYIRRRAENLSIGQEALPEGTQLSSASLALAGTMGHGVLEVIEKPRIAILSTDTLHHRYFINSIEKEGIKISKYIFETTLVKSKFKNRIFFNKEENNYERQNFFKSVPKSLNKKK